MTGPSLIAYYFRNTYLQTFKINVYKFSAYQRVTDMSMACCCFNGFVARNET